MFSEYVGGLREIAEATFEDTFTASAYETAKVDGIDEQTWVAKYETPGKVSGRSRDSDTATRYVQVGGVEKPEVQGGLHLPLDTELPEVGWRFECIAVGVNSDPSLVGRRWQVTNVPAKSYATARRLDVVEVPRASE